MKNENILDGVVIIHEMSLELRRRKQEGVILKITLIYFFIFLQEALLTRVLFSENLVERLD
jgi:hypothetical protein